MNTAKLNTNLANSNVERLKRDLKELAPWDKVGREKLVDEIRRLGGTI